jgi:predicted NBD/HSP70 family sugar kinase
VSQILGIDLGGTRFRAALAPTDDVTALAALGRWPSPASLDDFAARLVQLVETSRPAAIGVTVPGLVADTVCRFVPNLPFLDGVDLQKLLPASGPPLVAANDAQLAMLAEATHGAARSVSDAIMLAIGTGIGSAVLADGRVLRGAHGGACSFGWACADMTDPGDPRHGWLERTASGKAFDAAALADLGAEDGVRLIEAARAGDRAARAAIDRLAAAIGTTLAGAIALVDPARVLFAGGVSGALDVLAPGILAAARRQLPAHLHAIQLAAAAFGAEAGLVGAAVAAVRGREWWRLP